MPSYPKRVLYKRSPKKSRGKSPKKSRGSMRTRALKSYRGADGNMDVPTTPRKLRRPVTEPVPVPVDETSRVRVYDEFVRSIGKLKGIVHFEEDSDRQRILAAMVELGEELQTLERDMMSNQDSRLRVQRK